MIQQEQINKILVLNTIAKENNKKYEKKRFVYKEIIHLLSGNVFIGIAGLRGSGKTVLLRQLATELPNSLYLSMDTLSYRITLFDVAKEFEENYKIKYLMIDEIHSYLNWQQEIKKIFDFLKIKLIFTSSASIEIIRSKYDLSRRVIIVNLMPFSFREYIYFTKEILIEKISLEQMLKKPAELYQKLYEYETYFTEFCIRGALPTSLDAPFHQIIQNIVEKMISNDLTVFGKLNNEDILKISAILRFISRSNIDVCSYSSIAKNTNITKYKVQEYLKLLEQVFLIKVISPYGSNVTKEPKIVYTLPFRVHFAEGIENEKLIGAMREEFFVHHAFLLGVDINYLKNERGEKLADYLLFYKNKKFIFEIGGAGKTAKQLKGIRGENKFVLSQPWNKNGIPLLLFGFVI